MWSESEIFLSEILEILNAAYLKTPRHARWFIEAHIDALTEELMLQDQERRAGDTRAEWSLRRA
jgi:hypothetical protein